MKIRKWILFSIPLVSFAVLVFVFAKALSSDPSLLPSTRIGKPFPAFTLPSLLDAQKQLTQSNVKGPALLNVWATWCPSCQIEHPVLVDLAKNGVPIIGLNYKDDGRAARQYLQIHGNPYLFNIYDEAGNLGLDLGVYGAPETYLIDENGVIHYRHVGEVSVKAWYEIIWPQWQQMTGSSEQPAALGGQ